MDKNTEAFKPGDRVRVVTGGSYGAMGPGDTGTIIGGDPTLWNVNPDDAGQLYDGESYALFDEWELKLIEGDDDEVITIKVSDLPAVDAGSLPATLIGEDEWGTAQWHLTRAMFHLAKHRYLEELDREDDDIRERRDEWARVLDGGGIDAALSTYEQMPSTTQASIDRLIDAGVTP